MAFMSFMSLDTTDLRDDPKYLYTIDNVNIINKHIIGQKHSVSNIVKNIDGISAKSTKIQVQDSKTIYKFLPSLSNNINLPENVSAISVDLILNGNIVSPINGTFTNFNK